MADISDDIFKQFAEKQESEAKASSTRGKSFQRDLEEIHWTGLEQGIPSVVRVVGGPPDSNIDKYTSRTVTMATVIGDDGRKFRLIRPSLANDSSYIINKIINKVRSVKWVNGEKVFPVKNDHPEIYNLIEKNGVDEKDPKSKYEKGWLGREVLIMNVIDRARMDWHKENKHTMLLAKSVTEKDGNTYVEEGISSFASLPKFTQLFKYYSSWEKYDIAITRTGDMKNAFIIDNASKNPERVPECEDIISFNGYLTDEEKSWERYDLEKIYRVTTYHKIYNKLKNTIKRIDKALGTDFLTELEQRVAEEKELFNELYGDENGNDTPSVETVTESAPVTRTREAVRTPSGAPGSDLKYYHTLSDLLKGKIVSCVINNGKADIKWDMADSDLAACPECGSVSPYECTSCPCCGETF